MQEQDKIKAAMEDYKNLLSSEQFQEMSEDNAKRETSNRRKASEVEDGAS
jgi:hypothetical protein